MHINAHLDLDLIALDEANQVTCLLELTAPVGEEVAQRPGRTLVVVLDRSGSMAGEPLHSAREAIASLVRRLAPHDCFGLVVFDDEVQLVAPVLPMADHHLGALLQAVSSIHAGGSTNLSAGYLLGIREARASLAATGHSSATVLLLSDGHANAGLTDPERMFELARSSAGDRITTSTVGLGLRYDETLLDALTRGGNGNHRFADTSDAASAEIAQTVSDLLDVSVLAATLRITPSDDAVDRITVRHDVPTWNDERSVVIGLGDLYAGEQRRVLVQLGIDAVPELGTRQIAELQLQFTAAADLAEHRITLPVMVNVVPGDEARGVLPNPVVEVERLILEVDDAKRSAIDSLTRYDMEAAEAAVDEAIGKVRGTREASTPLPPLAAARIDETLTELEELKASFHSMAPEFTSKMMMESTAAGRGKASRRRPRPQPKQPEPSQPTDPEQS